MIRTIATLSIALAVAACASDPRPVPHNHRMTLLETYGQPENVKTQPDGTQIVTWRLRYGRVIETHKYVIDRAGNAVTVFAPEVSDR